MAILALIALGGLSMCGKNDVVPDEEDPWTALTGDSPITFTFATSGPATKTISPQPLPVGTTLGAFVSFHQGDLVTFTPNFMYNQAVNSSDTNDDGFADIWTYIPVKYWPNNLENKLSFWAYSPYTEDTEGFLMDPDPENETDDYLNTTTGIPNIHFTLPTDGQTDLMVTYLNESEDPYIVKNLQKQAVSGTVNLLFHHLLSRIVFHFVKVEDDEDEYDVLLTEVSIQGIYLTADHPGDPSGSWSNHSNNDPGNLSVYTDLTPEDVTEDNPDNPVVDKEGTTNLAVMSIPQTLTNTVAEIVISYVVISKDDGSLTFHQGEFLIADDLHPGWVHPAGWDQNYQYTYNVSIKPTSGGNPIVFSASISPWSDENDPDNYGYIPIVQ